MSTTNKSFVVKNGLAVGGASGIIDVIDSSGAWIGATGTLQGANGSIGLTGATGPIAYLTYGDIDMGTFVEPTQIYIDLGTF